MSPSISHLLNFKLINKTLGATTLLAVLYAPTTFAEPLANFSQWEQKDFVSKNKFTFEQQNKLSIAKITSNKASSGLFLKKQIDLNKTPLLNWTWKISNALDIGQERNKKGDDFSARVYVLTSTGPFPWQKKSISYVWSNHQKIDTRWPNPYTDKVMMLAVNSGNKLKGSWQTHQRNVQQDMLDIFGEKYDKIDVIAIMTDTDNSEQQATGWYKDISFSAQ